MSINNKKKLKSAFFNESQNNNRPVCLQLILGKKFKQSDARSIKERKAFNFNTMIFDKGKARVTR